MVKNLIHEEMRFYRHYDGIVVDTADETTRGRVRVRIEDLGQFKNDQGIWAFPRQLHALDVPIVGEIVEVYFINGDRTRAVYLANSSERKDQIPAIYSDPSKHVLHQDPTTGDSLVYDDTSGNLDLQLTGKLGISAGGKDLKTILNNILAHCRTIQVSGSATTQVVVPGGATDTNFANDQADIAAAFKEYG